MDASSSFGVHAQLLRAELGVVEALGELEDGGVAPDAHLLDDLARRCSVGLTRAADRAVRAR